MIALGSPKKNPQELYPHTGGAPWETADDSQIKSSEFSLPQYSAYDDPDNSHLLRESDPFSWQLH